MPVIRARNSGYERLDATGIRDGRTESLPERYAQIMNDVKRHAAGKFADDATLLLISVNDRSHAMASQSATQMQSSA